MDSTFITAAVPNIWNAWNIQGFMILSLCMQMILTLAAPVRRKTSNRFVIFVIWSTYLLSDWAAVFAFGLISNAGCRTSNNGKEVAQEVMAFWAAFLLIHLGGPDNITAFSLEDNALWLRHLVGLIAQAFAFLHIFVKTLPSDQLLVPTLLVFVAGVIKYGERTRALYLASLQNLKTLVKKAPDLGDITESHGEDDEAHFPEHLKPAFHFHKIFKGLFVDIMPNRSELNESRQFILHKDANEVFKLISIELKFLYEVFYTKIMAANSRLGAWNRNLSYLSSLTAFILFCLAKKDEFHGVDIVITYALLAGVFVLDVASSVMVLMSDLPNTNNSIYTNFQVTVQGWLPILVGLPIYTALVWLAIESGFDICLCSRDWSEKMGSFSLLSHCLRNCSSRIFWKPGKVHLKPLGSSFLCFFSQIDWCTTPGFIWEKLAEIRSTSKISFQSKLWELVFDDLKRKAAHPMDAETMRQIYEARGNWAIKESACTELMPYIRDFQYDSTLLIWHITTEICYNVDGDAGEVREMKMYSKQLSDYMMYLLLRQPKLMSPIAGIGHIRYKGTCNEVKLLGEKSRARTMREFCALILQEHSNTTEPDIEVDHRGRSMLSESCRLVRLLQGNENRWEMILKVWMELLSYAAGHCKADSHARMLCEGSEFITFVWMLMAHYGISAQFPVE